MSDFGFLADTTFDVAAAKIIDAIRIDGARVQSEVVRASGLGRAAVAQRLNQFERLGLVERGGSISTTRGRPPQEFSIRGRTGYVLVGSFGATSIDVALADLTGDVLAAAATAADISDGPEAGLARVEALFEEMESRVPHRGTLFGIGIGVPGPVEFATGRSISPPIMPGWDGYPIADRLSGRYGVPAWVDNDVNVMALGEWREGVARDHRDVVFVKIGTGIGAGIIAGGTLQRGSQGAAGDMGHIRVVDEADVICRCGNVGCLESLASGFAIGRDAERAAAEGRSQRLASVRADQGHLSAADVADAASHGDPAAIEILQAAGRRIGDSLASVVNLLNPSLIVIGGGVAGAGDTLLAAIRETIYRRSLPLATRHLLIARSQLGERAGVVGTAAMVLDQLFAAARFRETAERARATQEGATVTAKSSATHSTP